MAYTVPTTAEIIARFPQFEGKEGQIDALIIEAQQEVTHAWIEGDYKNAIMYWVAHMLTIEGADGEGGSGIETGGIASESFGGISVSYAQPGASNAKYGEYGSTSYGKQFWKLRARSFPGIVVV